MSRFYHLGPLLFHTEVEEKDLIEVNKLCHKNEDLNNRENLAGHIEDEFKIDYKKLEYILDKYFDDFKHYFLNFYGNTIDFYINGAWVNFMKAGDFNPIHTHSGTLSAVLFVSIPDEIKKENMNFKGNKRTSNISGPGDLKFIASAPIEKFITEKSFLPKNGDLFIFPSNLPHCVSPFKSKVERISIAFNLQEKI